jgi:hypothetical protein
LVSKRKRKSKSTADAQMAAKSTADAHLAAATGWFGCFGGHYSLAETS